MKHQNEIKKKNTRTNQIRIIYENKYGYYLNARIFLSHLKYTNRPLVYTVHFCVWYFQFAFVFPLTLNIIQTFNKIPPPIILIIEINFECYDCVIETFQLNPR